MPSEDLRVQKTRSNIKNAFIQLLLQKDFHNITIQNILDAALINRTTFYHHYMDKYDLAAKLMQDIMDDLCPLIHKRFLSDSYDDFATSIADVYHYLYSNKEKVLALCRIQTDTLHLYDDCGQLLKDHCLEYLATNHHENTPVLQDYYAAIYSGFVLSSIKWLLTCGKESDIELIIHETKKLMQRLNVF